MPRTAEIPINGDVLSWAMEEGGYTPESLADKIGVEPHKVTEWIEGTAKPTRGQFTKLVNALRRPSAIFLLPAPPRGASLTAGLRTAPGPQPKTLTPEQLRQVRWARRLQQALSDLREVDEHPVEFPSASLSDKAVKVAAPLREFLGVTAEQQRSWDTDSEALAAWRETLEHKGLFVLQLSLGPGVRGFSTWDPYAPLVAVNTHYNNTARIYSMLHEVGHLVLRDDASCANFVSPSQGGASFRVERWCEEVAAAVLLPAAAVRDAVRRLPPLEPVALAKRIANRFKVSVRASALRLIELGYAGKDLYPRVEDEVRYLDDKRGGGSGGGQVRLDKRYSQLGERLMETFGAASVEGRLSEREVRDYLKLGGQEFDELTRRTDVPGARR